MTLFYSAAQPSLENNLPTSHHRRTSQCNGSRTFLQLTQSESLLLVVSRYRPTKKGTAFVTPMRFGANKFQGTSQKESAYLCITPTEHTHIQATRSMRFSRDVFSSFSLGGKHHSGTSDHQLQDQLNRHHYTPLHTFVALFATPS